VKGSLFHGKFPDAISAGAAFTLCVCRYDADDFCSIDVAVAVGHILDTCTHDIFGRGLQCAGQVGLTGVVGMAVHASAKICTQRDGSQRNC
jgi:hypothetical protein